MKLNHRQAFVKTRKYFGIKGNKLHQISGVSENHISEFTRGKRDVSSKVLDQLIEGMEQLKPGAKRYYCNCLFGKNIDSPEPILSPEQFVSVLDTEELSKLMFAVAARLGEQAKKKNSSQSDLMLVG